MSPEQRLDPVTGRAGAQPASGPGVAGAESCKLGLAGYDLWPHAVSFCHALEDADYAHIAAVWDDEPRHLARLVELTGATGYSDLDEFCRADVEGVIITARTSLRRDIAVALAGAGKHVLSDKPMAMTASECVEIIDACGAGGVVLMGGYNFRFWKVWPQMKQILDGGLLGAPIHLYFAYNTGMVPRSEWETTYDSDWTDSSATPGGGWFTHGDHGVDLVRWLFDTEFTEVLADMRRLRYPQYDVEDYGVVHGLLANGATAVIHSDAIATAAAYRLDAVVICEQGGMSYTANPAAQLKVWGPEALGAPLTEYSIPEHWVDALGEMVREFVSAVNGGESPSVTGEDNLRVIEVTEAAYRSSRDGRRVRIEPAALRGRR